MDLAILSFMRKGKIINASFLCLSYQRFGQRYSAQTQRIFIMEQYRNSDTLILQLVSKKFIILEVSWELSKYSQIWKGSWKIFTLLISWVMPMKTLSWSTLNNSNTFPSAVSMLSFSKDVCSYIHSWEGSLWTSTLLKHQCLETFPLPKHCFPQNSLHLL